MRLIAPEAFAEKYFADESRPPPVTVRRWMRDGKVPARKIGGTWFVDEHAFLANGNPLVQRILEAG